MSPVLRRRLLDLAPTAALLALGAAQMLADYDGAGFRGARAANVAFLIAAAGDALLAPPVTRRLIEAFARLPTPPPDGPTELAELTAREREILTLVASGMSNTEIAGELVVGESTVKTHVGNILMKLGLRDRVQAVVLAYETGLVRPGG